MRKIYLVLILIAVAFTIFRVTGNNINTSVTSHQVKKSANTTENPFGIMVGAPLGMKLETKIQIAQDLGVTYYRPTSALFLNKWKGICAECQTAKENGFKLVLTIRNGGGHGNPSDPPENEQEYTRVVREIVDAYEPEVLVVENEENSMELFYSGTPSQYNQELKIACKIAHEKNLKCTNGGLVSSLVIGLVYDDYLSKGQTQEAQKFLNRALTPEKLSQYKEQQAKVASQIDRGKELLAGYKTAGADYVNFHWYSESPEALGEAKTYIENTSGLPAISNEMGQQDNVNPTQVRDIMQKVVDLNMPIAVWYSLDTLSHGQARGLAESNGILRENGVAFQNFISESFSIEKN